MESPAGCPKCGHVRQPSDTAPEWQCPACGVAIEKFRLYQAQEASIVKAIAEAAPPLPRLPLAVRMANATPDALTAGVFAWCWISPAAWRLSLTSELGAVMIMEFFAMHSGVFFAALIGRQSVRASDKFGAMLLVFAFYMPIAGVFGYFQGGWWPVFAFFWLLLSQSMAVLTSDGSGLLEGKRYRFYWGTTASFYILGIVLLMFVSVPKLGFGDVSVPWSAWYIPPQTVMAWGVVTFGATAITRLLEQPGWIAAQE